MSKKNIYEVFDDFVNASSREAKIDILRRNSGYALDSVLRGAFHPYIKYVFNDIPQYKKSDAPPGLSYTTISQELSRVYLFEENNPRVAANLTLDRKKYLLIQMLEALESREAEILSGMLMKKLPVKGLTYKLVQEAFPAKSCGCGENNVEIDPISQLEVSNSNTMTFLIFFLDY